MKKKVFSIIILILGFFLFYKPLSQFIHKHWFTYRILPILQEQKNPWEKELNSYLSNIQDVRVKNGILPRSKTFCTHTLVGGRANSSTDTTLFLWAHCQEYGFDGKQLIKGMGAIQPVVIHQITNSATTSFAHKTVSLKNYNEEINSLFPWYISIQGLTSHKPEKAKIVNDKLRQLASRHFKHSELN